MGFAHRLTGLIARNAPVKNAVLRAQRPIASITFDDFPRSAWTIGGPLLQKYGARGTYFTSGSLNGRSLEGIDYYTADDLGSLRDAGHEIGCHGFAHEPTPTLSNAQLTADADRNAQFLRPFLNGEALESYAFPFGEVSLRTKRLYSRRFSSVRGVHPGINEGTIDLAQLRTVGVENCTWNEPAVADAIARARNGRGWIVFHTHDVSNSPSPYGCTPVMLEGVLKRLSDVGIEILPMREALQMATGETI